MDHIGLITDLLNSGMLQVGTSRSGEPITADDLGCGGALTVLMKVGC